MSFDFSLAAFVAFLIDWAIRIAFLLYIPRKRKPSSAIAWLLVIFLLPFVGIVLFLVIGSPKLSKRRRQKQHLIDQLIESAAQNYEDELKHLNAAEQTRLEPVVTLARSLGKLPARAGNSVEILPDYDKAIDDIVSHIKQAKEFVHLEYFILALDDTTQPIFDAMTDAIQRGVKVRVLFDWLGSKRYPRYKEMKKLLTDIGADWHLMLPLCLKPKQYNRIDLRNHRKILVIDETVAYIGSQNLIHRTYHRKDDIYYDELVARMSGPIVRQCAVVFASDWFSETNERLDKMMDLKNRPLPKKQGGVVAQILPSGPGYDTQNNARLFTQLIHAAQKKIVITNPYFVPDDAILEAITSAARRGVSVTLVNSEAMDQWMVGHAQRSYYEELMLAGVQIYLYKHPILLHSKHMTIDDDIAVIGSSNMDIRSFELDLECVLVTYSASVVSSLRKIQQRDLKHARLLKLKAWNARSVFKKFLDSAARLTAALQ